VISVSKLLKSLVCFRGIAVLSSAFRELVTPFIADFFLDAFFYPENEGENPSKTAVGFQLSLMTIL
jgi:hypothetical protein